MAKETIEPSLFDSEINSDYSTIEDICGSIHCQCNIPGWVDNFGNALNVYLTDNDIPKIRTLSLFSGAGGLDIGFHDLGFEIIESVEIEEKFCDTLKNNSGEGKKFPNSKVNCIDIREYKGDNLGQIDFIIGGPPCQTFSAAGRRQGGVLGTTDLRGVLFREYVRLLKKIQPKGFLFENVYGIIGAQGGEAWREIQRAFSEVGYKLHFRIVDAADYGVPQHRERLIIVGLKEGTFKFPRPTHGPDSINGEPFYSAGLAVKGLILTPEEKRTGINGRFGHLIDDIPPGLNYSFYTSEMGHPNPIFAWRSKFSDFMYKADPEMPVRTIKAQGGQYTGPLHWDSRYFSYSEFKRLQTFPDDYAISGVKAVAIHQIGNSVPPQLARMLALAIRIQVFSTVFPFKLELLSDNAELTFRKRKRELTKYYQSKAKGAIEKFLDGDKRIVEKRDFLLNITEKFKYVESETNGQYKVSVDWSDSLTITIHENDLENYVPACFVIRPTNHWTLPVEKVILEIFSNNWMAVTAGWKVLDRQLIVHQLKADLVQLNGYFQYGSKLKIDVDYGQLEKKEILEFIFDGTIVSKMLSTEDLASIWNISDEKVLPVAQELRRIGYEVRNHNTNPQIPNGTWLIPYKFPTLLPESVQTYKTLV